MKYTTLNTVNMFNKLQYFTVDSVHNMETIKVPYMIDDSKFCPTSEALKNINGAPLSDKEIAQLYDFPDGNDNGQAIPIGRGRFNDITELSVEMQKTDNKLKSSYNEFKEDTKRAADQKKRLEMLKATKEATSKEVSSN